MTRAWRSLPWCALSQLGPDFQNFLCALAHHGAKNQTSANLRNKPCLESLTAYQAICQKLRSFLSLQASNKILAAIFEGVTESGFTVEHLH